LFVDDRKTAKTFCRGVFGLKIIFEDEVSAVVNVQALMINLLETSEPLMLVEPAAVAVRESGAHPLLTVAVEDAMLVPSVRRRRSFAF